MIVPCSTSCTSCSGAAGTIGSAFPDMVKAPVVSLLLMAKTTGATGAVHIRLGDNESQMGSQLGPKTEDSCTRLLIPALR